MRTPGLKRQSTYPCGVREGSTPVGRHSPLWWLQRPNPEAGTNGFLDFRIGKYCPRKGSLVSASRRCRRPSCASSDGLDSSQGRLACNHLTVCRVIAEV
jgi:hypothetical protein